MQRVSTGSRIKTTDTSAVSSGIPCRSSEIIRQEKISRWKYVPICVICNFIYIIQTHMSSLVEKEAMIGDENNWKR